MNTSPCSGARSVDACSAVVAVHGAVKLCTHPPARDVFSWALRGRGTRPLQEARARLERALYPAEKATRSWKARRRNSALRGRADASSHRVFGTKGPDFELSW